MIRRHDVRRLSLLAALACGIACAATPGTSAALGLFSKSEGKARTAAPVSAVEVAGLVRQALNEERYVDAGTLIDGANFNGVHSAELTVLTGELCIARSQFNEALPYFERVADDPGQKAAALQGKGIALSMLDRSDQALAVLEQAVTLDKNQWRAWNALGREYDLRREWAKAIAAYDAALAAPGVKSAIVLNNRGFSFLLQNKPDAAAEDLIAALAKDPGLAAARTNLRIALAWQGAYARAAVSGAGDDRAAVLNNVGLAAALHGDYAQAETYLNEAMAAKGQYYQRAADNLALTHGLAERGQTASAASTVAAH